ncbi:MAG: hypothetical protein QOH04_569 [Sphingomonadales bacterium]|jgi:hypothetical protein|nr:hypothetical protein [Sphingomonadales bacterium]
MDDSAPPLFDPVPGRARRDGWTPKRQRAFIDALAGGMGAGAAARAVGMSKQTAYALRRRPGAESFAAAWDEAVGRAKRRRCKTISDRTRAAIDGMPVPIRYRGRIVGTRMKYDNPQLIRLLGQAFARGWIEL